MKHFTKEYIELCDCDVIQKMRPKIYFFEKFAKRDDEVVKTVEDRHIYKAVNRPSYRKYLIWLPDSGQLDEEIVKICTSKRYSYRFDFQIDNTYGDTFYGEIDMDDKHIYCRESELLIAKLKLLIELLEEE